MDDKNIIFVTTTLYTKWLNYQSKIIKDMFPESEHIIVDGRQNWPNSWFYWIDKVKNSTAKYFIHIDEDFFLTSKDELLKTIDKMESDNIDIMGVPDGYHHYRGANPVAINTFLMIGRVDKIRNLNFNNIKFGYTNQGWINNYGIKFKEDYKKDWNYTFKQNGGSNFEFEQEPYYAFLWTLKEMGFKFDYLFPHFDDRFKSTNPRLDENSDDIGIHMWYTRQWNSDMDVHGLPNIERYNRIEEYLKLNFLNNLRNRT